MKNESKKFLIVSFLLSFILFAYSPQSVFAASGSSRYGGQMVLATTSDPNSFNDIIAKETTSTMVTSLIFEGLTTTDAHTLKVKPNLAQSWDISDDGLQFTFHLRQDVKWNDGQPLTADDVVFTFNDLIYNPDIPSSARDVFTVEGKEFQVEALDKWTVRFILPVKFAPFLRGMGQAILPKHKLEQVVKDGDFNFTWGIDTDPKEIVGTGAFRLTQYQPGQRLVFEPNPYYWKRSKEGDRLPYLSKLIYLIVQNSDVELLKFLEGSLDVYGLRGLDYSILKPLEHERNFTIYDLGPATGSNFLTFNLNTRTNPATGKPYVDPVKSSWFNNISFREAVALAVDRDKIIEIVKSGLGYPQYSPMGPATGFFHNPNVIKREYDLDKARRILTQAGFEDRDGDGIIEDPQGHPVKFNLYTNAGNTERIQIAEIIRYDFERLGMDVNFQVLEFNTLVGKMTSNFDWDAIVMGLTGGVEPHFGQNVWMSAGQLHMWNPRQDEPATDWEQRIDEIFVQGVQELNEDKRKALYDEYQYIVSEQLPFIYTVLSAKLTAVRNKFGNLDPTNYGGVLHNLEEIYIKK